MSGDADFRGAISASGLTPPETIIPGKVHRIPGRDKKCENRAGWCVLFEDGQGGAFGDWSSDVKGTWQARRSRPFTLIEQEKWRLQLEHTRRQVEEERKEREAEARERAHSLLSDSTPCSVHEYITKKGIGLHGLTQLGPELVIPLRDGGGVLTSLQFIGPDGGKRFLKGGRVTGSYHIIGNDSEVLCIAEGFATAASIHEASGHQVVIAFNAGNLKAVAMSLRAQFPAKRILLCADSDPNSVGEFKALDAAQEIGGLVVLPRFAAVDGKNTDFNDLHQLQGLDEVQSQIETRLAAPLLPPPRPPLDEITAAAPDDEEDQSQATLLVSFVCKQVELFHDANKYVYAQDRRTRETRRLDSGQFKDWLVAQFYESYGKSPREQALREALTTLAGLGRFKGALHDVFIRVAQHGDAYYLDLAEPGQSRAVKIEAGIWQLVSDPPVRFVRPDSMRPLPRPIEGGDFSLLWQIANVPEEGRLMALAWLADCLRPDTPFPILELIGEQGSAKSTTQTVLRKLIDPNACDLRAAPKTIEDVFVIGGANWLTSYENISHLSQPMQDALCVLATGGGYAKRKLYSDADESILNVKRPIVLNGIAAAITAQDLVDRTLSIELPRIESRQEMNDLWGRFNAEHGRVLGAFLDLMAKALAILPQITLPASDRPRLVEFARLGMAIAKAMSRPGKDFLQQFTVYRQEAIARTIDASPVASAIMEWFEARGRRGAAMSAKALLAELELSHRHPGTDAWPRAPKGLGDALRRSAPALRQLGIECRCLGKRGSHVVWEVKAREGWSDQSRESLDVVGFAASTQDMTTSTTSGPDISVPDRELI